MLVGKRVIPKSPPCCTRVAYGCCLLPHTTYDMLSPRVSFLVISFWVCFKRKPQGKLKPLWRVPYKKTPKFWFFQKRFSANMSFQNIELQIDSQMANREAGKAVGGSENGWISGIRTRRPLVYPYLAERIHNKSTNSCSSFKTTRINFLQVQSNTDPHGFVGPFRNQDRTKRNNTSTFFPPPPPANPRLRHPPPVPRPPAPSPPAPAPRIELEIRLRSSTQSFSWW